MRSNYSRLRYDKYVLYSAAVLCIGEDMEDLAKHNALSVQSSLHLYRIEQIC